MSTSTTWATAYLDRLDVTRPDVADLAELRRLHAAHLDRVPFENLDIVLGGTPSLKFDALVDKIVTRRRGGFCYELNGLFGSLLAELGYDVTLLAARMWDGTRFGPPLDHLVLLVATADGTRVLADVGSGRHTRYPLHYEFDVEQDDPDGVFRLEAVGNGEVVVHRADAPQYRIEPQPRRLADFTAMCWYQAHAPDSHFTTNAICSLPTPTGRVSLREDVLIVTTGDHVERATLPDDAAILAAYRDRFGVVLDRVPRLTPS